MATPLATTADASKRQIPILVILGVLVVAQIIAFWMLCNQQVVDGHARNTAMAQQQTASSYQFGGRAQPATGMRSDDGGGPNTLKVSFSR